MSFSNRVRLPFKITRPQFPDDTTVYRKADGSTVTQSVVIRKVYEGETDYLPERWHERLVIALGHDNVAIEGTKYFGGVSKEGSYDIDWPTFLDFPTGKAKFKVNVTPFDGTNSNCQSCEDVSQIIANDDTIPFPLEEDTNYQIDVSQNDEICCFPTTFSIVYNSDYIDPPTIDNTGKMSFHTKTGLAAVNGLLLATYRLTCPNGGYDEANVYADVNGTVASCLAPQQRLTFDTTTTTAHMTWVAPSPAPDHYYWQLYEAASPALPVQSGPVSGLSVDISGLTAGTDYTFYVRSQCDATNDDSSASNFINVSFTTPPNSGNCGQYGIFYQDPGAPDAGHGGHITVTYLDCSGVLQSVYVPNFISRGVCAMQTAPGSYVRIDSFSGTFQTITYETECS